MLIESTEGKPCEHNWRYDHNIYQFGMKDSVIVRRCSECAKWQRAVVTEWEDCKKKPVHDSDL